MTSAIATSTLNWLVSGLSATVPSAITMISADSTKSVRMAPLILSASKAARSTCSSATAASCSACWRAVSSALCSHLCASFSTPSRHRYSPPSISSGVTAHGAKALIARAAGTRIALFFSEPTATAQTTGNSRSLRTPETCSAFRARSSPSTPAVFLAATLVMTATSSRMEAISSSRASRLAPAMGISVRGMGGVPGQGASVAVSPVLRRPVFVIKLADN